MKKITILFVVVLMATMANAQFYTSLSAGYAFPGSSAVLGTETNTAGEVSNVYGSYGAGFIPQFRAGYMTSDKFGLEVGLAYLNGKEYTNKSNTTTNINAAAKAYGLSVAAVYNITDNFYGRFGLLTKVGGKTVAKATVKNIPEGIDLQIERNFRGQFPLGYIGSLGYRKEISENLFIFGELEYSGIAVKRKKSELVSITGTFAGQAVTAETLEAQVLGGYQQAMTGAAQAATGAQTAAAEAQAAAASAEDAAATAAIAQAAGDLAAAQAAAAQAQNWATQAQILKDQAEALRNAAAYAQAKGASLKDLHELVAKEILYEDSLNPANNSDLKKRLTETAPYSSFGLNIGITYIFK